MSNITALVDHQKTQKNKPSQPQMGFLYFSGSSFIPKWLGDEIISKYPAFYDGSHLYFYMNGVYRRDDGGIVGRIVVEMLGDSFKQNRLSETITYIKNKRWIDTELINPENDLINLKNGLLNWKTGELKPHTPEHLSTIQLPINYNPDAASPNINKFFSDIVPGDTVPILYEWFGYSMIPNTRHEKAMILTGSGANGKSKLIELYERFIGERNISNVPLQDLEENRFKLAQLYEKLANVYADIPANALEKTNVFKTVTSGDSVSAEFKGKDSFNFKPFARLLFSANELPRTFDLSDGYFRRLLIVEFPNKFGEGGLPKDPNISEKLTTEDELSGLLNNALEGLKRLERNQQFSTNQSTQLAIDDYKKSADPVQHFIDEVCIVKEEASCDKMQLYDYYSAWCMDSGFKALGKYKFYNRVASSIPIQEYRPSSEGRRRFRGVGLSDL